MPTHKRDLTILSTTDLADLAGMAKETVAKRLRSAEIEPAREDGRTVYYRSRQALPALFQVSSPQAEKARLDKARADLAEHDLARKRGDSLEAAEVEATWTSALSALRSRLLAVAPKVAPLVVQAEGAHEAQEEIRKEIEVALAELSEAEARDPGPEDEEGSGGA